MKNFQSPDLSKPMVFRVSPLIRITLLTLYVALTLPLPFLAKIASPSIPPFAIAAGLPVGFVALYGALSERVALSDREIQLTYPRWVPKFFRRGWSLPWEDIQALKPRTTGQGGLVYYFLSYSGDAYLLPMRIADFDRLVHLVHQKTGLDTRDVVPLAQPWMYRILLAMTAILLIVDIWAIAMALSLAG